VKDDKCLKLFLYTAWILGKWEKERSLLSISSGGAPANVMADDQSPWIVVLGELLPFHFSSYKL
jgi:hypothetical protein